MKKTEKEMLTKKHNKNIIEENNQKPLLKNVGNFRIKSRGKGQKLDPINKDKKSFKNFTMPKEDEKKLQRSKININEKK